MDNLELIPLEAGYQSDRDPRTEYQAYQALLATKEADQRSFKERLQDLIKD